MDDIESHQYRNGVYSLVEFSYSNNILSVTKAVEDAAYFKASNKMIDEVVIMNVETCPTQVLNRWLNNTPYPDQGNVEATFVHLPSTKELHIFDIAIPVDDGLIYNVAQDLIEVIY